VALVWSVGIVHRAAAAQDFGAGGGSREPLVIATRFGLESTWASFDLGGTRGSYFGFAARADWRASSVVGLRLIVPVYTLGTEGQPWKTGLGDSELRLRVLVLDADDWRVFVGLTDGLPTGDTSLGVGQGATQLTPFVTAGWKKGPLVLYATVADSITLRVQDKPAPIDYVDPSTDHEMHGTLGAIVGLGDHAYATAAVTETTVLVPSDAGDTILTGGVAVGILPGRTWKLVAGGQLPLAGQHRFDAKASLDAYVFF
jgi:hypothetical protein